MVAILKKLLAFLLLTCAAPAAAHPTSSFKYSLLKQIDPGSLGLTQTLLPTPANEQPPVISCASSDPRAVLTTSYAWYCQMQTALTPSGAGNTQNCSYVGGADTRILGSASYTLPGSMPSNTPWRRNYWGLQGMHVIPDTATGQEIIALVHGENKNETIGGNQYQNQVNTNVLVATCSSGDFGAGYVDCTTAYNGFISSAHAPYVTTKTAGDPQFVDDGPVIWPSAGYVKTDGVTKATSGVTTPRTIIKDGYLYMFYNDGGTWFEIGDPGRQLGTRVARAPLPTSGKISGFVNYFQGHFANEMSLPAGFTAANAASFYQTKGGRGDIIIPNSGTTTLFSAAHFKGTGVYLGVAEHCDITPSVICQIQLYLSDDLAVWSGPVNITETQTSSYASFRYHYPVALNAPGDNSQEIDQHDFWIMGSGGGHPNMLHLNLNTQ